MTRTPVARPSVLAVSLLLIVVALQPRSAFAQVPSYYGGVQHGRGTWYGVPPMPPNTHVHCHLPNYAMGLRTIAMNKPQYDNSKACGMCVEVEAPGNVCEDYRDDPNNSCGLGGRPIKGKFIAIVTDELVERGHGDIDIGEVGDGHWPVYWRPIPCPIPSWRKPAIALHAGANKNYMKVQFRYGDSPMAKVLMDGVESYERTHDNYFVFRRDGDGFHAGDDHVFYFEMWTMLGRKYCGNVDTNFMAEPYEYHAWDCTPQ